MDNLLLEGAILGQVDALCLVLVDLTLKSCDLLILLHLQLRLGAAGLQLSQFLLNGDHVLAVSLKEVFLMLL